MKRKVWYWVFGILGVLLLGVGVYAYTVYSNVSNAVEEMHSELERGESSEKRTEQVDTERKNPISILVMGVDQRSGDKGRSDTLMVVTLNPGTKSMKMLSIPRDTYTEIVGKGTKDKINHSYAFGGVNMTVNTVENFLDIPIDYYVEVNMEGFQDIVDAVGGIDVNNDLEFTYSGIHFEKGQIHLNGKEALVYARMRKQDARGDFGRQMRQRQVVQAVIQKGASVETLANYTDILGAIQKNVRTNLTQQEMLQIQQNYSECRNETEEIQIPGEGQTINKVWYYVVPEQTRQQISQKLRAHLELK